MDEWKRFVGTIAAAEIGPPTEPSYLFRGQPKAEWPLIPSLGRVARKAAFNAERALELEQNLLTEFRTRAHLHFPDAALPPREHTLFLVPESLSLPPEQALMMDWLTLMQHYGAPTRLLDWTASPYVALYFAVERDFDHAGAVWMVHPSSIEDAMKARGKGRQLDITSNAEADLMILWHYRPTDRMAAQQTNFSVSSQMLADHGAVIAGAIPPSERGQKFVKFIIPPELKLTCLRHLRRFNITARSLFPGVDGLGRSISELATLIAPPTRPT